MLIEWDEVPVGAESGSVKFVITDEMVDQHIAAAEMENGWLGSPEGDRPGKGRIAPVDMMSRLWGNDLLYKFHNKTIGQSVRYKQAYTFYKPARVGMEVSATGYLKQKYEKRDRKFIQYEVKFFDSTGDLLVLDERTLMVLAKDFQAKS